MKKRTPLHTKILLGMLAGTAVGAALTQFSWGGDFVVNFVKPLGNMFVKALKLIAIPLILASLIKGISDLKDISKLSKMGLRTTVLYLLSTVLAISIGLILVNLIAPGDTISEASRVGLLSEYAGKSTEKIMTATSRKEQSILQPIEDIISDNFFESASDNSNMLQVIFFALFFGIALILIPKKQAKPIKKFFDGLNEVILKMIDLIMMASPYGVFALLATLIVQSPNTDVFISLGYYALTVVLGLFIMLIIYALVVSRVVKITIPKFFKSVSPAQLVAFSTSSSAATLPVTKEQVERELGVDEEVSSFVLPLGATINMDGTSLYQAVAAVFIAQAFGMDLNFITQLGIVVTALLSSIGSAAVPSASIVLLVMVLSQAGIPEAGIGLIFAVDRPLDMCRTMINITGDMTVSVLVAKSMKKLKIKK